MTLNRGSSGQGEQAKRARAGHSETRRSQRIAKPPSFEISAIMRATTTKIYRSRLSGLHVVTSSRLTIDRNSWAATLAELIQTIHAILETVVA